MPTLEVYVSEETMARLERCASELGRDPDELAECAVAEAALAAFRNRPENDPAAARCPRCEGLGRMTPSSVACSACGGRGDA